ncbi:5-oxoprolinase subunit B family protein [Antarctobacter jejuensis]|uniref:5-oxoprolinase subunit B family protein n=1 Tax=Antarctobacter jejuensis TaxID=1439938 RepID=UPI003FD3134F
MTSPSEQKFPRIDPIGLDGVLVRFGDSLSEPANRAALAFCAAMEREAPDGVEECATSLVSAYVRFDPLAMPFDRLAGQLDHLLKAEDWYAKPLPEGRRLIRIPTVYGGDFGPQLDEAAQLAGMSAAEAVKSLTGARVRVNAIGFAPGQPYLGTLPEPWDIPRQTGLTPKVPEGALVVAIRQFVLFSVTSPTGWRQVGRTAAPLFRPDSDTPFRLRPGDEVIFDAVPADSWGRLEADPKGGIVMEALQ